MRGSSRRIVVAAGAMLLATASGCGPGEDEQPATLPPITPSSTSPSTTPSPSTTGTHGVANKQQVRAIYADFLVHHIDAQDEPRSARRQFLAKWMADPGLTEMVKGVDEQERKHQRATGRFIPDIMTITIDGPRARVDDCVDQSKYNVKDVRTDEILTSGDAERFWGVTTLKETSDGWRVIQVGYKDETCTGR